MDRVKRVIHCDRAYKMGLNGKKYHCGGHGYRDCPTSGL